MGLFEPYAGYGHCHGQRRLIARLDVCNPNKPLEKSSGGLLTGPMMQADPAVIIHHLDDALRVAKASEETGTKVACFSVRAGAASLGPELFEAILATARDRFPGAALVGVLDCGEDAGAALDALHRGSNAVSVRVPPTTRAKLTEVAQKMGALVARYPQEALDLAVPDPGDRALMQHIGTCHKK